MKYVFSVHLVKSAQNLIKTILFEFESEVERIVSDNSVEN